MPLYRLIGDVHGKYKQYKAILKASPYPTIQVGDMGVGFRRTGGPNVGEVTSNPPHYAMVPDHRFIRGNHDNPAECRKHSQFIPDGTILGDTMFVGGAVSVDREYRQPGYSWWEDEEVSHTELIGLTAEYCRTRPRVMITHECPESMAEVMVALSSRRSKLDPRFASRTRQAFEAMLNYHQPELWVFGHWHYSLDTLVNDTRFVCLAELEYKDFELELS